MEGVEERRPLLINREETNESNQEKAVSCQGSDLEEPVATSDWRVPATILGIECLESMAFNGIATNLVVYLRTVLHDDNASSAAKVSIWYGTSYFVPIVGAVLADTWWGSYMTVMVSLILYFLGMMGTTLSSLIPTADLFPSCDDKDSDITRTPCNAVSAPHKLELYLCLFLIALGCGGVRSSLLPFGADQFIDTNHTDQPKKSSFFSWFYVCVIFGVISSGTVVVWVQENVSWSLGFAISTFCVSLALVWFLACTALYRRKVPSGSPLKSICQVLVASLRKIGLNVSKQGASLFEVDYESSNGEVGSLKRLAHTSDFRFLDKAAIMTDSDLESNNPRNSWSLCTVTQVEELKILLRLAPIWATGVLHSAAFSQMHTTFIQQGKSMDTTVLSFSVPAASLYSFEVICVVCWVFFYNKVVVPTMGGVPLSQLQRIGIGRFLIVLAMSAAAVLEMMRLEKFRNSGSVLNVTWQLPQYFIVAGSEFFSLITQLEFFHGQAPDALKNVCTAFALLCIALGNYLSSLIITMVALVTTKGGESGWLPNDLNKGHMDYYFWMMTAISGLNFVLYIIFARRYKLKEAILTT
ncbi:Protein NRT1/ PTR FAMILY 8.5 [Rhynchospora pubera]|uniref:Protein NRT1/ PTR FAMILY 8.5 n=1 Tax=Rhynchospora pubera TaxID=906938 RepID=A0AAV8GKQ0_9POAL|nr:Protein NRT1/ PTR FAMILY 8.5 [Rhynchospora pubera]